MEKTWRHHGVAMLCFLSRLIHSSSLDEKTAWNHMKPLARSTPYRVQRSKDVESAGLPFAQEATSTKGNSISAVWREEGLDQHFWYSSSVLNKKVLGNLGVAPNRSLLWKGLGDNPQLLSLSSLPFAPASWSSTKFNCCTLPKTNIAPTNNGFQ